MEWTAPSLMPDVGGWKWTLASRRYHSAQGGSIRFPSDPEGATMQTNRPIVGVDIDTPQ